MFYNCCACLSQEFYIYYALPICSRSFTYAIPVCSRSFTYALPACSRSFTYALPVCSMSLTYAVPACSMSYTYALPACPMSFTYALRVCSRSFTYALPVCFRSFTYALHLEALNTLLVLLSVQMYQPMPASRFTLYKYMMQGRRSAKWQCWMFSVKSFIFVGTHFHCLTTIDMFVDTWIRGFQIICNISKAINYFVEILNVWIALPTKYTKINVQLI